MHQANILYLDHAAHTPPCEAALAAFMHAAQHHAANPHAAHPPGRDAAAQLTQVTAGMAACLGAFPDEVIHTSGATEANNLAIAGLARAYAHLGRRVLTTPLEHPSVTGPLAALQQKGYQVEVLRLDSTGTLDLPHLETTLRAQPHTALVCVSAVDSELGVVQPVAEVARLVAAHSRAHLHVDAAQAVGKVPVPWEGLPIATMSLSAHKLGGVVGSGALLLRRGVVLAPLFHGGTHSASVSTLYRAGTPALALAASFQAALAPAMQHREARHAQVAALHHRLATALAARPGVRINSPISGAGFSPYILNVSVDGVTGHAFVAGLAARGVCVSVKSACATDTSPSRAVLAISNKKNALAAWRISLSHTTTTQDVDAFLTIFHECCAAPQKESP